MELEFTNKAPTCKELRAFWDEVSKGFQIFPLIDNMLRFVLDTATAKHPTMTKMVCQIKDVEEAQPFVLIWATANLADSPLRRIEELKEENALLQRKLAKYMEKDASQATGAS